MKQSTSSRFFKRAMMLKPYVLLLLLAGCDTRLEYKDVSAEAAKSAANHVAHTPRARLHQ